MKSKYCLLGLVLALALGLVACGGQQATQEPPQEPAQSVQQSAPATPPVEVKQEEPEEAKPFAEVDTVDKSTPVDEVDPVEAVEVVEIQLFNDVDETVYAVSSVNIRASWSANSEKLGSLSVGDSVKRTGVSIEGTEAEGWSRVELTDGSTAYISSKYLSATKPVIQQQATPTTSSNPTGKSSGNVQQQVQQPVQQEPTEDTSGSLEDLAAALKARREASGGVGSTTGPMSEEGLKHEMDGIEFIP